MANSKLIVVEGAQGAGKTIITDYLRYAIPYTNLYRLSGISDSSLTGKKKSKEMYENLLEYIKKLENKNINLVFDRTFFSEENYCRLKYKEYSFSDIYEKLLDEFSRLDFEIYYITLYLEDENLYLKRLDERNGKAVLEYAKFKKEKSIMQQKMYLQMSDEIEKSYKNINCLKIENSKDIELVKKELKEKIGF